MKKNDYYKNILHQAIDVIVYMAYINALWVAFSLLGGIVFGVFPATAALYEVIRQWEKDGFNEKTGVLRTFFTAFRQSFWKANAMGGTVVLTGGFLLMDLSIVSGIDRPAGFALTFLFSILTGVFMLALIFMVPVFVHFEAPLLQQIKYTVLISLTSLPYAVLNVIAWGGVLLFFTFVLPAASVFFAASILGIINMKVARKAILRIEQKQQKAQQEINAVPQGKA